MTSIGVMGVYIFGLLGLSVLLSEAAGISPAGYEAGPAAVVMIAAFTAMGVSALFARPRA